MSSAYEYDQRETKNTYRILVKMPHEIRSLDWHQWTSEIISEWILRKYVLTREREASGSELCPMVTSGKLLGVFKIHTVIGFSFIYFSIILFV